MLFGTWNVRRLQAQFFEISMKRINRCKLHVVAVLEVIWDKDSTEPSDMHSSLEI
jgi:hypothetical protein